MIAGRSEAVPDCMPRVAFSTLGCKVNASETESFISGFLARGYRVVPFDAEADVYVVNTCTVTSAADRKSRQEIRQGHRANPLALVVATGCYVSVAHRDLGAMLPGNLLIVHNREKEQLIDRVEQELARRRGCTAEAMEPGSSVGRGGRPAVLLPVAVGADAQRTRATLKVQDGCNAGCTFCIIPRARGGPRSVPLEMAVEAARTLEAHGYRELVLTGVLLGSYGRDLPGTPTLASLIERLLKDTSSIRIRLSSIEPRDLQQDWLDLWRDSRLCRHLHLPLQSGSDALLLAMRRPYNTAAYTSLVAAARDRIPDLALTTDVLVGFPGEDETHFGETVDMLERTGFASIHVFRYSLRPGTVAARMQDQVPDDAKTARSLRLRELAAQGSRRFHRAHAGTVQPVLWERAHDGVWHGLTDNYLQVYTASAEDLHNKLITCRLETPYRDGLWATPQ